MKKYLFLDLDGTLLPMNEKVFVDGYFKLLLKELESFNLDQKLVIDTIWNGTYAMYKNNGEETNENVFWKYFYSKGFSKEVAESIDNFYNNEFKCAKIFTHENPYLQDFMKFAKENFDLVVLATNPIFPKRATIERMSWVGLKEEEFDFITTYENCSYSKPNPKYFEMLLKKYNLDPSEVLMIGNNDKEDYLAATTVGIDTIIIDDNRIINNDIEIGNHCEFKDLLKLVKEKI